MLSFTGHASSSQSTYCLFRHLSSSSGSCSWKQPLDMPLNRWNVSRILCNASKPKNQVLKDIKNDVSWPIPFLKRNVSSPQIVILWGIKPPKPCPFMQVPRRMPQPDCTVSLFRNPTSSQVITSLLDLFPSMPNYRPSLLPLWPVNCPWSLRSFTLIIEGPLVLVNLLIERFFSLTSGC